MVISICSIAVIQARNLVEGDGLALTCTLILPSGSSKRTSAPALDPQLMKKKELGYDNSQAEAKEGTLRSIL